MKKLTLGYYLILAACLLALLPAVQALDEEPASTVVLYQTTFSTDPRWTTNNPSNDYWDQRQGIYHFKLEPSTGNYAFVPVEYDEGPFTLEYDVKFVRIDEDAAFRLGFSGPEMDFNKGPNVLTAFTNAKFGRIMWLQLVSPGNKQAKVNSQNGDELSSGPLAYKGPTVKYELNKTYHVTVNYDDATKMVTMKVNEKTSGKDIWGYFVNAGEDLRGMNRIYLGSKGDYNRMGIFAEGEIDNVRLTAPAPVTPVPTPISTFASTPVPPTQPTAKPPTTAIPTIAPVETPQSPVSGILPVAALGIAALIIGCVAFRRR